MFGAQAGAGRTGGFYLEAISGIDLALWDLRGKAAGQPVHRLLGGPVRTAVPVYASPIPFLPSTAQSVQRALSFVDDGFHAVKLKLGRGEATDLAPRHRRRRRARRPRRPARRPQLRLRREDRSPPRPRPGGPRASAGSRSPSPPTTSRGSPRSARRCGSRWSPARANSSGTATATSCSPAPPTSVMPNLTRAGGITEVRRIAALCSAFHVDVSPHGVGSAIGLAAALQFAAATPNVTEPRIQPAAEPAPRRPGRTAVPGGRCAGRAGRPGPRRHPRRGPHRALRGVPCLTEPW